VIGEQSIKEFADGVFPAHLFLKSNLYGEHEVHGTTVGKPTVINFFVDCALAGESLTVYEPGTQARNFIHIIDVDRVYVRSTERLLEQLESGVTGTETYEVAGEEDMSVMHVAKTVREAAREVLDTHVDIELIKNPRKDETMVEEFGVDISATRMKLNWTQKKY
jgi:UDP-glucose 4-epimerase